jgi:oligopeptide/dipeptide ABC transporter ATP-binding protein
MYMGKIVEIAPAEALYRQPLHPYTRALLAAVPVPDPTVRRPRALLSGEAPTPLRRLEGCVFQSRCALVEARCRVETPPLADLGGGRHSACHLVEQTPAGPVLPATPPA